MVRGDTFSSPDSRTGFPMPRIASSRRRPAVVLLLLLVAYLAGYAVLRAARTERWEHDGRMYVIYPAGARLLYYLFRPIAYVYQAATGTGAHIEPHRPVAEAAR
jgi:hypothetical protein